MFNISKKIKEKESIIYVANSLVDKISKSENKCFAVSSSFLSVELTSEVSKKLILNIAKKLNKKVLLINCMPGEDIKDEFGILDEKYIENLAEKEVANCIEQNKGYDLIFVNLPPVNFFANSLEIASMCKNIILIEKCMYTKYKKFEETLLYLEENNVEITAVVPIK